MILYIGNILSSKGMNPSPVELIRNEIYKSSKIKMIVASDKKNRILRFLHMNYVYWGNYKRVSLMFIDVYSTQAFYFTFYFALISKILSLKYIPIIHGGNIDSRIKKSKYMTEFVFKNADINISPSRYIYNIFKNNNFEVIYIPNCINFSFYNFKKRKKIRPRIIWLRSFHEIYNPKMAINVFKIISTFYDNTKLTMIGPDKDGSLNYCQKLSKKYNIDHKIDFLGYLNKTEWIKVANDHDIFINTSTIDNLPVSIIEMMALGLPVVSTDVGGIPFILKHRKNSLLVKNNDEEDMAYQIKFLIDKPLFAGEISAKAFEDSKNFSTSLVIPEWSKIIKHYS
tara:strand:- start:1011 stop:2030 length:1020 start_codon:yes stop_codon:yes gene_type:complete